MSSGKYAELRAHNNVTADISADSQRKANALKEFNAALERLRSSAPFIVIDNLQTAVNTLIVELETIRATATLQDLQTGIKVMKTILSAASVNTTCYSSDPFAEKENKTSDKLTTPPDPKVTLKNLAKELETKGATWGKVLGVVLIIAGILLSIASFATMIPSFGASGAGVGVGVTWTLAGLSFFSTSIGAGLEWGFADASTDLSIAVERVAKVI